MLNVPKVCHFYWGAPILPFLRYATIYSFRKYNPDWKIIFYVPKKISPNFNWPGIENKHAIEGKDFLQQVGKIVNEIKVVDMETFGLSNDLPEVTKSDFLRLNLLSNDCGLWLDTDIVFFLPVEHAFTPTEHKSFVCFEKDIPEGRRYHSIGFLMSSVGNETFKVLFDNARKHIQDYDYQAIGSPFYEKYININNLEVFSFSNNIVYPIRWPDRTWNRPAEVSLRDLKPETIGVHWYAGHPTSGKFQNLLTESNFSSYNNIICFLLSGVFE